MDLQFLLDRYKWELDRKDKISAAVNFPVTLLILVSGLLATLFPKLQLTAHYVVVPVVVLYLAAVGFGIASLTWFIRAYRGSTYLYLPLLAALDEARAEWRRFYEYAKSDRADEDFFEHEFPLTYNRGSGQEHEYERPSSGLSRPRQCRAHRYVRSDRSVRRIVFSVGDVQTLKGRSNADRNETATRR